MSSPPLWLEARFSETYTQAAAAPRVMQQLPPTPTPGPAQHNTGDHPPTLSSATSKASAIACMSPTMRRAWRRNSSPTSSGLAGQVMPSVAGRLQGQG